MLALKLPILLSIIQKSLSHTPPHPHTHHIEFDTTSPVTIQAPVDDRHDRLYCTIAYHDFDAVYFDVSAPDIDNRTRSTANSKQISFDLNHADRTEGVKLARQLGYTQVTVRMRREAPSILDRPIKAVIIFGQKPPGLQDIVCAFTIALLMAMPVVATINLKHLLRSLLD